jgi:beta-galactosidase GanA
LVNGQPFLMRAAELNNSSLSSPAFMRHVWPKLVENNINTVLGAVSWDQIEPEEGRFDFNALDQVIRDARSHGLKLVLLWFGSFKNGIGLHFAPSYTSSS